MKRFFNVKRLLAALLLISLFIPSALAGFGDEPNHSCVSVVNSEKNVAKYKKFAKAGELSILIPALDDMFVPQGMTYYAPENLMFFTGYYGEGYSSTLFAVDMATNEVVKEILLAEVDGSIYDGHAGGVAVTGKNIYISDNNRLYRLPLSDFHNAAPMDVLGFAEAIPVPCEASYCQINNGVLWVGEFYYKNEKKYHTDPSHEVKSEKGTQYNAWLLGYKLVDHPKTSWILHASRPAARFRIISSPPPTAFRASRSAIIRFSSASPTAAIMIPRFTATRTCWARIPI